MALATFYSVFLNLYGIMLVPSDPTNLPRRIQGSSSSTSAHSRKASGKIHTDAFCYRATSWVRRSITTMKTRSGSKYCIVELASSRFILSLRSDQFLLFHCLAVDGLFVSFALV
ncbi:hypothetical protein ANCDUO_07984 [Ancylostoma duodenale]|uniref:Secreted protein n=1 Tax=Ancylostoma duodenale TaxID=51022 RepID=A0A0C2CXI5_9BILA|nr:hypothetical protein ANCDUO_07984 [Ancylostoma duodenale]